MNITSYPANKLSMVLLPVHNPKPASNVTLELTNNTTHKTYTTTVKKKPSGEQLSFASFDMSQEKFLPNYTYTLGQLTTNNSCVTLGVFYEGGAAYFSYYIAPL